LRALSFCAQRANKKAQNMTTFTEFRATRVIFFDIDATNENLDRALTRTGWADFELLEDENATAAYFYDFTHSDNPEPARYIIVRDDKGRYITSWAMGCPDRFNTLEEAEEDLHSELNG
jgi:hypothetical protein